MQWMFERGDLARDGWETVVDGDVPGWQHTGLRVAELAPGASLELAADSVERIVVPLTGGFTVRHGRGGRTETTELAGRSSVFDGPTDVLYLAAQSSASVERPAASVGSARVAIAEAPVTATSPDGPLHSRHITRDEVPVELRGSGRSSRQVHNFGTPGSLDAQQLIVCEVITPAENWSSYPPHKHDTLVPGEESRLEEIYYFETAVTRGLADSVAPPEADPFGFIRTYGSEAGEIDLLAEVRTGDVALVPHGWHGPCVAAPGYDLYYLNVMAGPDPERVWHISDDPAHGWIRGTWNGQEFDPRLPYTAERAPGTTAGTIDSTDTPTASREGDAA